MAVDEPDSQPSPAWTSWWRAHWLAVLSHLAMVGLWSLASTRMPKFILPSPLDVLLALMNPRYNWPRHMAVTASEVFGGFALASIVGVSIAVIFSWWLFVSRAMMPLLVTINMIPKVAMAPLFIVWLSYGIGPNILITFTICFFPIVINTTRGLKEVEPDLIDLVRVLRASRGQILTKVQLPSALPFIFSGMRVAAVLAVAGAVVGEFIGSERGLGYAIMSFQSTMDTPGMFVALALITLVGVVLYGLVILAERCFVTADSRASK
ncbi:nitrate ABC transporter permease [Bradyrhizobium sp. AS23.2]|nr:nitrate ABC transporter permease [Bradyrhizobium sp. AS23.2]